MDTVSIIIPVCNSAAYLPACLDSVLAQTWPDTEIILVENGSTDESPRICADYAAKHPAVRLLQGDRRGPGSARNLGLRAASGPWVVFVDSDDLCEPDLVRRLMEAAAGDSGTLALCGIRVTDENNVPAEAFRESARRCDTRSYVSDVLSVWKANPLCGGVYGKLFSLPVLRESGVLFEEDAAYAEDFVFNLAYLPHVRSVVILPDLLYRYRCGRPGSLTEKNLREAEFESLRQRRMDVVRRFADTFAAFGLDEQHEADIAAFHAFQLTDLIQVAARRSHGFGDFRPAVEVLVDHTEEPRRGGSCLAAAPGAAGKAEKKGEIPAGIPPKDQKTLRLLFARRFRALWLRERLRRRLRILRGRERW